MKKVLLASSVLALSATVAAAEVTIGGDGRMGVTNNNAGRDLAFTSRVRVSFSLSGETDGGLAFGGSIRADNAGDTNDNGVAGDAGGVNGRAGSVFISGAFGKITMGDVDSAANALVGNVAGVGMTGLGDANELGYLGNGTDPSVLYTYSTGAISIALSAEQPTAGDAKSVAVKYAGESFSVALGFEDNGADQQTTVGVTGNAGDIALSFVAADRDSWGDTHYAVSASYSSGAMGVTAFYANHGANDSYGVGGSYSLGGGATVVGGISKSTGADAVMDLGVTFSF